MKGKLIIIEAGDGSGKATQAARLYEHLAKDGKDVCKVEYPDYKSESSALVKMYLRGDFGESADAVNAYTASTFYAVDRYASYQMKWKKLYENGAVIIADRYTTSNMVHQAGKIQNEAERNDFLEWLCDLEFVKMGLPKPDLVIFLDMPPQISDKLLQKRGTSSGSRDIHERDKEYLHHCYAVYKDMTEKYGWKTVECVKNGQVRSVEEIHNDVYALVKKVIE